MSILSVQIVEISEVPVEIKEIECCGHSEWYGRFPPGLDDEAGRLLKQRGHDPRICCFFAEHDSFAEAVRCCERRVARGFEVKV